MPDFNLPFCSRAWPRVAVLALLGVTAAGCSGSARLDSNPYASNSSPPPQQEMTGSLTPPPATSGRVDAQPLPAPNRPATVGATGAQGFGTYRPTTRTTAVSGSVPGGLPPPPTSGPPARGRGS